MLEENVRKGEREVEGELGEKREEDEGREVERGVRELGRGKGW